MSTSKPSPFTRGLLGLLLLLPAFGLCTVDQFWLTLNTFITSLTDTKFNYEGEFIGFTNYGFLFEDRLFPASLGYTTLLVIVHILAAAILPPLLALAVNGFGKKVQRGVRLWFTLPLAYFGPALVVFGPAFMRELWKPDTLHRTYLLVDGVAALAVACGIGLIVYLAVLRGQKEDEKLSATPLVTTWIVTQLAVAAYALQSLNTLSMFTSGLGGKTPLGAVLLNTVRNGQFGFTSAISIVIFILSAILGVAATLLIIVGKLQLSHSSDVASQASSGNFAIPGLGAILLGGLAVVLVTLIPFGANIIKTLGSFSEVDLPSSMFQIIGNTILPPLMPIFLIQLPIAYLGAISISVVKPFGKASEWLLLLFSPWLFVTAMPFALAAFQNLRAADLIGSPLALTPPILLSVPMLFILALFFKGQSQKWQSSVDEGTSTMSALFKHMIVPSLPLALFMSALALLAATQEVIMPFMVGVSQQQHTLTTAIVQLAGGFAPANTIPAIVTMFGVPISIIFFIVFAVLQVSYLEKLSITREA